MLLDIVRGQPFGPSFTKAKKYIGFMTLGIMTQEVFMILLRDKYLKRERSLDFLKISLTKVEKPLVDQAKEATGKNLLVSKPEAK